MSFTKKGASSEGHQRGLFPVLSRAMEGVGKKADFIRFLIYAHASCDETIEHLRMIGATHDSMQKETDDFLAQYDLLGGKINKFFELRRKQL